MNVAIRRCAWAARASTFCAASAGMGYSMGCGPRPRAPVPAGAGWVLRVARRRSDGSTHLCALPRGDAAGASSPLMPRPASCSGLVPRQQPAHGLNQLRFRNGNLRWAGLAPLLGVFDGGGGLGTLDQILDLYLAARDLVRSLDDDARTGALVGVLHLCLHAGGAKIHLGAHA